MRMALKRTGLGGSEKCWFADIVKMSKASASFALNEHNVTSLMLCPNEPLFQLITVTRFCIDCGPR